MLLGSYSPFFFVSLAMLMLCCPVVYSETGLTLQPESESLILRDMEGVVHNANELLEQGENIALVFWQTWCVPCIREMPNLVTASRANRGAIRFFGVISGTDEDINNKKVEQIVKKFQVPYPQIRDRALQLTKKYKVKGTPTIIVLGQKQSILYAGHRPPKDWAKYRGAQSRQN